MNPEPSTPFKSAAVIIAVTVLAVTVLTAGGSMLFGTKMGRLFGMSPDALAGNAWAAPKGNDGGTAADAGMKRPRFSPLGATKAGPVFHPDDVGAPAQQSDGK